MLFISQEIITDNGWPKTPPYVLTWLRTVRPTDRLLWIRPTTLQSMPSIDLYVNYGVHGVRDCSRPAMAMDGIQYLREVRGRPPPVESVAVGLLTGGPDRRRPGSIYTPVGPISIIE